MAGRMDEVQYVSDNGTTYWMKMDDTNATAVGAADEPSPRTHAPKPNQIVPRYINCEYLADPNGDGTGQVLEKRRVICPDPTEGVWTGSTDVVSLPSSHMPHTATGAAGGRLVNFNITSRVGEKRYAGI